MSKKKIRKEAKQEAKQEFKQEQKIRNLNQQRWNHYILSLLVILSGLVFIVYTQIDVPFICNLAACIFAIAGIVLIVSYIIRDVATGYYRLDLVYGIMLGFLALVFYTKQGVIETYFPVIAGLILFANGLVKLQHSIDMKRIDRKMKRVTEVWLVVMIFALMCIAAGAITVYMTPAQDRKVFLVVGISFVVAGLSDIFTDIVFTRKVKEFKSGKYLEEETKEASKDEPEVTSFAGEDDLYTAEDLYGSNDTFASDNKYDSGSTYSGDSIFNTQDTDISEDTSVSEDTTASQDVYGSDSSFGSDSVNEPENTDDADAVPKAERPFEGKLVFPSLSDPKK